MSKLSIRSAISIKEFARLFFLWLLCIPINFLPIILKSMSKHESDVNYTIASVLLSFFHDLDYCFVFISALFVLYLQAEYARKNSAVFSKVCRIGTIIVFFLLLIDYFMMFAFPSFKRATYDRYNELFNISLGVITIIISFLIHLLLSIKEEEV